MRRSDSAPPCALVAAAEREPRLARRLARVLAVVLAAAGATALPVAAQEPGDYPSRPIRIIIPNTSGGTSDILARLIGARLGDAIGQPIVVESRPGAAGRIALEYMAKAAPDGYTLLLGNNGTNAIVQSADAADARAPVPVVKLASLAIVVAATPALGVKTLPELIERARRMPGALAYASSGIGSTSHLAAALLSQRARITMLQIPYAGTASAVKDVLAGEVPLIFTHLGTVATLIRAGQIVALAVSGPRRAAAFPDVPTIAESGFPGFDVVTWHGVLVPPGTPRAIVMRLHAELIRILAMPELREELSSLGMEPLGGTPEAFAADIAADRKHWASVIRDAGLPPQ